MKKTLIILLVACSSCGSIVTINSVPVHSPTRKTPRKEAWIYPVAFVASWAATMHFTTKDQRDVWKAKIK